MKKAVIFLLLGLLPAFAANARTQEQQAAYDAGAMLMASLHGDLIHECDAGGTTYINQCIGNKYTYYDKILNQVYQLALAESDNKTRVALQESQRRWLVFRNDEAKAQNNYIKAEQRGTVMGVALGYQNLSAIRERIAELMMYLGADQG